MMSWLSSIDIVGMIAELCIAFLLSFFRDRIQDFGLSHKDIFSKKQKKVLKDYSGILPIDHSGSYYIYNKNGEKNLDVVDKGISFIIPNDPEGEWYVFGNDPCSDGMNSLVEVLESVLSTERVRKLLADDFTMDKLETMITSAREEASSYINSQTEQSLYGISRIILNRKGNAETPWCNFLVFKTDLYTRNTMHILFNKLFPTGHNDAFLNIEDIHLMYPFIFELKLSISLISEEDDADRIILKKAPYEFFEQKDIDDKWLLFASESIGQEDLSQDNTIDLEDAVMRRLYSYDITVDNNRIDFHDIFFVTEQLSVSVLTSAVVPDHVCKGAEKSVSLDVNGIFEFLNKYGDDTADYCKYSLIMWLSRHCMENV